MGFVFVFLFNGLFDRWPSPLLVLSHKGRGPEGGERGNEATVRKETRKEGECDKGEES